MPTSWERSRTIKRSNVSRLFPDDEKEKRPLFIASFERKTEPAKMSLILGWEYGRQWLKERDEFLRQIGTAKKPQIQNDFDWWLKKRNFVIDRRKRHMRQPPNEAATKPNHNLSAFAELKKARAKTNAATAATATQSTAKCHSKNCTCHTTP